MKVLPMDLGPEAWIVLRRAKTEVKGAFMACMVERS